MSASSKGGLYAVCGSFIALSVTTISLRFFARIYQKVAFGLDDWIALFGVTTYIAAAAIAIHFAVWDVGGYGDPTPAQSFAKAKIFIRLAFAYDFLNVNTLACAKLSAVFMYRRIFAIKRHGWFNWVLLATAVVIVLWYISSDFLSLYQCPGHFSALWHGEAAKYCTLNPVWAKQLAISDFLLDVWVLVLPIIPVMRLHTTMRKKLSILGVFLLAFVGLGASIVRMVFFIGAHGGSAVVTFIAMLEEGMSITVVNLPSIYYICTSVIPGRLLSSLHSLHSLVSNNSRESQSHNNVTGEIRATSDTNNNGDIRYDEQVKAPATALLRPEKPGSSSQGLTTSHGNRTDLEEAGYGAYVIGDSDSNSQRRRL